MGSGIYFMDRYFFTKTDYLFYWSKSQNNRFEVAYVVRRACFRALRACGWSYQKILLQRPTLKFNFAYLVPFLRRNSQRKHILYKFCATCNFLKTHHVVIYLMRADVPMVLLYSVVPSLASLTPERQKCYTYFGKLILL